MHDYNSCVDTTTFSCMCYNFGNIFFMCILYEPLISGGLFWPDNIIYIHGVSYVLYDKESGTQF